jgi:hypothetical protein
LALPTISTRATGTTTGILILRGIENGGPGVLPICGRELPPNQTI